jgi:hypothetical protein
LVAVTRTRSVRPMSVPPTAYVAAVAPATSTQPAPSASQRSHCRSWSSGVVPFQAPVVAVRTWRSFATPEMLGAVVLAGASGATTAVVRLDADATPSGFVAVTSSRSVEPTSAGASL